MYNPAVDDSEPLNPDEDGSGFYNALSNSPEFNRFNESAINKAFSDKEMEKKGNMRTPTKQGIDNEEQFSSSKKGTPRRKTTKTPGKLRFNVAETQPSSTPKRANTTKHTRSASTGQQYIQHSPPPSPRFNHPYQQLMGMGGTIDKDNNATSGVINNAHNIDIDATTSFANAGVESPPLNYVEKSVKVATDSPSVDVGSPVTTFFRDALQQQQTTTMLPKPATVNHSPNFPSVHSSINSSFANKSSTIGGAYGFNTMNETPTSMTTVQQGVGNVWGASPQKPAQDVMTNTAPESEWTVSPELREKFATQFRDLKPENGFLYGDKARVFFLKSKLQSTDLSAIWKLSDVNKDGKLSEDEFCIAMKMVLVKRKGYDIPSTIPESLLKSIPSLASMVQVFPPTSSVPLSQTTVAPHSMSGATTAHLPSLQTQQQHHQHKPQSSVTVTASGGASTKTSAFPTQLPLLPPPSRKQLTKNVATDSPSTTAKLGCTEIHQQSTNDQADTLSLAATAAMAADYSPSKTGSLSHSNWPTSLTSDSGKPLRFHSPAPESIVPLPQSPPQNDQFCPLGDSNEKSTLVTSPNESGKKPLSKNRSPGPPVISAPLIDLGQNSEIKPSSNDIGPSAKPLVDLSSTKPKSKKAATLSHKVESADEDSFDDDEDETSALYASVKPSRPKGGKSSELKPKHSTLRASSSFKKQKPKPPPRPEPYNRNKRRSLSPQPFPVDITEAGYADLGTVQTQRQSSMATSREAKPEQQAISEPVAVTDPNALYAKVIKRNKSLELMEPIAQPNVVQQQPTKEPIVVDDLSAMYAKVMKGNKSIQPESHHQTHDQENSKDRDSQREDTKTDSSDTKSASNSSTSVTAPTAPIIDAPDGIFGYTRKEDGAKLLSIIRVESDSKVIEPETPEDEKPVPLPRKKRHHTRSSSLDLNKVFEKRKSAEQLTVSPDSLTKDLPSAVPPKPPPKPKKHKPTSNDQELLPPLSRSASLDSINTPSASSIVTSHRDYFERFPPPLVPIVRERSHSQGSENILVEPEEQVPATKKNKKVPILPPHLRPKQDTQHISDHHHTTSSHIEELQKAIITNSREHLEEPVKGSRDKTELQKNIQLLQEETKALSKLNRNLQEILHKLMEERTTLSQELESRTTKHHS